MKNKILKRTSRNKSKKIKRYTINFATLILFLIVIGFIYSGINRFFYNDGKTIIYPDLNTLITKTAYEKKTGHRIQIEISNGCGIPKLAQTYTNFLRSEGIDVLESKNADNFNHQKTIILHHRGEIDRAFVLADIMKVDKSLIKEDKNEQLFFDLTLILGEDYSLLPSYRDALMHQQPF